MGMLIQALRGRGVADVGGGGGGWGYSGGDEELATLFGLADFDDSSYGSMSGTGAAIQSIVSKAGGGKRLRFDWYANGGADLISICGQYNLPLRTRTASASMKYMIDPSTTFNTYDMIKKTMRFRGWKNGTTEAPLGTFNIMHGRWMFGGDDYATGNVFMDDAFLATHGPDTCIGTERTLRGLVSYPGGNVQIAKFWVDGQKVIDSTTTLILGTNVWPEMPSNDPDLLYIKHVYFMDTYNESQSRIEFIDDCKVYIP